MWLLSISNLTFIVVLARVDQIPSAMQLQTGVLNPLRCKLGFGDISAITKPSTTSPYLTDYLLFQNAGLPDNNYQPKHTFRAENRKPMGKKALCFKNKVKNSK